MIGQDNLPKENKVKFTRGLLTAVLLLTAFASAQVFTISDVGIDLRPVGVNLSGQVAATGGCPTCGIFNVHALLWSEKAGLKDLGTLPGGTFSFAYGLNNLGDVVGLSDTPDGCCHATLWPHAGGVKDLGTLGGTLSIAFAINDVGMIAGQSDNAAGCCRAFLWTSKKGMRDLGLLKNGTAAMAFAIDPIGIIAGTAFTADTFPHAFLWSVWTGMVDSKVPYSMGSGTARDRLIGTSNCIPQCPHDARAFKWSSFYGLLDLGTLPGQSSSTAYGINYAQQIVGYSGDFYFGEPFQPFPFLYTAEKGMQNLNDLVNAPGWQLFSAVSINNNSQIVGTGTLNGDKHGFMLTKK